MNDDRVDTARTQAVRAGGVDTAAWTPTDDERAGRVPVGGREKPTAALRILPETIGAGRYRVTGQLGVGGMGVVVRARDHVLDRDVAIKLLADNLALDEGANARFLQEARAAARLGDPRVVTVHDVGDELGRPYLVMELVDGPSLAEVLAAEGPLDPQQVLGIASDALGALASAHAAGLLHRDVKPGNLLRAPDGTTKVTDFGVAVAVDSERLTRTGFVIGTAGYLAPERRRGEDATVRTDLWALGATLTELLSGHAPGPAADAVLRGRDDVPLRLLELRRRLLADHADDRPSGAVAALELLALDPARSGAPTPPPQERSATRAAPAERDRRVPGLVLLAGLALLAGLVMIGVLVIGRTGTDVPPSEEPFGPVVVDPDDPSGTVRDLADQLRERAGR